MLSFKMKACDQSKSSEKIRYGTISSHCGTVCEGECETGKVAQKPCLFMWQSCSVQLHSCSICNFVHAIKSRTCVTCVTKLHDKNHRCDISLTLLACTRKVVSFSSWNTKASNCKAQAAIGHQNTVTLVNITWKGSCQVSYIVVKITNSRNVWLNKTQSTLQYLPGTTIHLWSAT